MVSFLLPMTSYTNIYLDMTMDLQLGDYLCKYKYKLSFIPPSSNAQWAITQITKKSSSTYFSYEALGLLHLVIRRTKKILLLLLLL